MKWLTWSVLIPLGLPSILALAAASAWGTVSTDLTVIDGFVTAWSTLQDVSPWTLLIYANTLLAITFRDYTSVARGFDAIMIGLIIIGFALLFYSCLMVVFILDGGVPGGTVYVIIGVLLLATVALGFKANNQIESRTHVRTIG
ncbi:hypothetical protein [uncultured Erythrobacter sp.]|uniref:hypothetical protein n=1 Tax=uncultured Erythrobacter sp. TaxID=263913 RepID=UPI002606077A|nr:hypothetical protein [uncultured Erythrobacter sp.]